jgi:hypothetical protein
MFKIETCATHPTESQLSERLRSACLLMGSSMLDVQAEANILSPLFGQGPQAGDYYKAWKSQQAQSYISQVGVWAKVVQQGGVLARLWARVWARVRADPRGKRLHCCSPRLLGKRLGGMGLRAPSSSLLGKHLHVSHLTFRLGH